MLNGFVSISVALCGKEYWSMREYSYQLVCVLSLVSVHINLYNPSGGMESIKQSLRLYRALMSKEGDVYNELNANLMLRR